MTIKCIGGPTTSITNPPQRFEETGFAGGDGAVCVKDSTTDVSAASTLKACLVALLCQIFELAPALGMAVGRLVFACWPGFREA